jgi:uncharacterized protein YqgC (DUF456 family)
MLIGAAGSILPAIPGPPVAYLGLWLAQWSKYDDFSTPFLIWMGVIMLIVTIIDNVLPPYITQKSGGSRYATIGSIIGMIVGIFFTAIGMLFGMLLGAFIGELLFARKGANSALRASIGAFTGFLLGTGAKLLYCFYLLYRIIF